MRTDWLLTGVLIGSVLLCAWWAIRDVSQRLASYWRAFQYRPVWFRWLSWAAVFWVGLRLVRAGARPFLLYTAVVGGLVLWAAGAARTRRP